jgi:hypothetical protein
VALDSRLKGEQMFLRSNMKKFKTESSWKLEICGAAFKPLPMYLNRQLIKILEDLNVPSQAFFDLQDTATSRLRYMTESPYNTSLFLKTSVITKATQISSLIWHLGEAGLDYRKDEFLSSVVDMAVVTELRDIKYRGRILVDDGMTLYGIMDETGYLQEGQVFVITEQYAQSSYKVWTGPSLEASRSWCRTALPSLARQQCTLAMCNSSTLSTFLSTLLCSNYATSWYSASTVRVISPVNSAVVTSMVTSTTSYMTKA